MLQKFTKSAALIADASQHLANVLMGFSEPVKSRLPFVAGLVVGARSLCVEITPVARRSSESVNGLVDGIVGRSVLVAQRGKASAVEMDCGNSGHEEGNDGKRIRQTLGQAMRGTDLQ